MSGFRSLKTKGGLYYALGVGYEFSSPKVPVGWILGVTYNHYTSSMLHSLDLLITNI
ncbi:hypothetical protein AGMMS50222_00420 [Endomicrobiia bacterium]|nr:hypothetical protein AGMMS49531_10860 [Endomicrobiia bacterium]GHT64272.1 hypothetical protein AGMMS49556_02090 [Endomicrobiia bacterium]GHT71408.1 hypothetical protein AGMMS49950_07970 [Endomicrobiia bacterium]GHT73236.1 hypothetical protein AGMMS50222_00420 [Endomicrobiia bacterium]